MFESGKDPASLCICCLSLQFGCVNPTGCVFLDGFPLTDSRRGADSLSKSSSSHPQTHPQPLLSHTLPSLAHKDLKKNPFVYPQYGLNISQYRMNSCQRNPQKVSSSGYGDVFVHERRTFRNLFVLHRMHLTAEWGEDKAQHPALWTWHRIKVNLTISFHVKSNGTESSANICQLCRLWSGECSLRCSMEGGGGGESQPLQGIKRKKKKKKQPAGSSLGLPLPSSQKPKSMLTYTPQMCSCNLI